MENSLAYFFQSRGLGLTNVARRYAQRRYLPRVAIPSLLSNGESHNYHAAEQDANRRAFIYFNERDPNFQNDDDDRGFDDNGINRGWNFDYNPLDVDKSGSGTYVNYRDPISRASLNGMWHIRATSWDKAALFYPLGIWVTGINNGIHYRNQQP
jgi:hypothetical protein